MNNVIDILILAVFRGRKVSWLIVGIQVLILTGMIAHAVLFIIEPTRFSPSTGDGFIQLMLLVINCIGLSTTFAISSSWSYSKESEYHIHKKENVVFLHCLDITRVLVTIAELNYLEKFEKNPKELLVIENGYTIYGYETQSNIKFQQEVEEEIVCQKKV